MPLFDTRCPTCQSVVEVLVYNGGREPEVCPDCETSIVDTPLHCGMPPMPSGPLPSKPFVVKHAGLSFDSPGAFRDWKKKHPTARIWDKNDREYTDHVDEVRQGAELDAQRAGYRDVRHRREAEKRDVQRKRELGYKYRTE